MVNEKTYTAEEIFAWNDTEKISKSNAKDLKNKNFYHYTTVNNVKNILLKDERGNRFFFVRNIAEMNDLNEAELHKGEGDRIHSFCTCCTKHEKIPLWYLYSGICGDGARLGITPGKMISFLNSIDTVYPVVDSKADYGRPLRVHDDFEMSCGWVYYVMDGDNRILYKNKTYAVEPMDEEIKRKSLFVKNYPWEYEREFRIIIINKTKDTYDRIAIPLPDELVRNFEIMSAPEYVFTEKEKDEFTAIQIKPQKIKSSKLSIRMDLLRNNREHIIGKLDQWCDDGHCSSICAYIQSKEKCKRLR